MIKIGDRVRVVFEGKVTEMRAGVTNDSINVVMYKVEEDDMFGATLINGKEEHITKLDV